MIDQDKVDSLNQASQPPIEDLALVATQRRLLDSIGSWNDVGILFDEDNNNTVIVLLADGNVVASIRFCLSVGESVKAMEILKQDHGCYFLGFHQGHTLTSDQLNSIDSLNAVWSRVQDQTHRLLEDDLRDYFEKVDSGSKDKGRGKAFSTDTKRKVLQFSHGRCMFEGCGEDLGIDELSGYEGNFSYLAHNIGSSENTTRSGSVISKLLADDPKNVLLLCDKHHRLIDKIASADFHAQRLSDMRRGFRDTANVLLKGLAYEPRPAYAVLWPVNSHVVSHPSEVQIAQCLAPIKARMQNSLNLISDNEAILREQNLEAAWSLMPREISRVADKLLMQTHTNQHKAALFAFGMMPALIGLGAKIGNKSDIVPMLRYRDGGRWMWPSDEPAGEFFSVSGLDNLVNDESEVVLSLGLTAKPTQFLDVAKNLFSTVGAKHIEVNAKPDSMGNGALAHPSDGILFMKSMFSLLHKLKDEHQIKKIHLLPCASNAACVFFGKAIDNHHPEIEIYDFHNGTMIPRLIIDNKDQECRLLVPSD